MSGADEYVVGIDPGITGAIALLSIKGNEKTLVQVWDMPICEKMHGKGGEVNPYMLSDIIAEAALIAKNKPIRANVEVVGARPGQGVTSMFGFGMSYGMVRAVLASYNIRTSLIQPVAWKRQAEILRKEKDASRSAAIANFENAAPILSRKKDNGRADAILIASYDANQ